MFMVATLLRVCIVVRVAMPAAMTRLVFSARQVMGDRLTMLIGAAIGAAAMYYFDPVRGRYRRALVGNQLVHAGHKSRRAAGVASRDLYNRAVGTAAALRSTLAAETADDAVLEARVRACLGRIVSHAASVHVEARQGVVTLSGPILENEVAPLVDCVERVHGVAAVRNELDVHGEPGNVPGLQGGSRLRGGERAPFMQSNWSPTERLAGLVRGSVDSRFARVEPTLANFVALPRHVQALDGQLPPLLVKGLALLHERLPVALDGVHLAVERLQAGVHSGRVGRQIGLLLAEPLGFLHQLPPQILGLRDSAGHFLADVLGFVARGRQAGSLFGHGALPIAERCPDSIDLVAGAFAEVEVDLFPLGDPRPDEEISDAGSGAWSSVICGIDWATATRADADAANDVAVANLSLGGVGDDDANCGRSNNDLLHQAICASVARGIVYVASAGNANIDPATVVPAAYDEVLTVSALADYNGSPGGRTPWTCADRGPDDTLAIFSNHGADVDLVVTNPTAVMHDITVPALGIQLVVPPGTTRVLALGGLPAGTYVGYCSVPGHAEAGMRARVVVE